MKKNFDLCLDKVLEFEGGYVNHPKDPGGATNHGVTQRVYDSYRASKGKARQTVKNITNGEIGDIYKKQYWDAVRGDDLPSGLDLAVFDFAVNSGPVRAIRTLQKVSGVEADGVLGPATIAVAKKALIGKYCEARLNFLRNLDTFDTFGKGWTRRVNSVAIIASELAHGG